MDRNQMYPDPDATQAGAGGPPFYGHAGGEHSDQSEQMSGFRSLPTTQQIDDELQRALASRTTHTTHNTSQLMHSPMQSASVSHHQHEQDIANALTMSNHDQYAANAHQSPDSGDGSRKRSKVSRACDECRRKKVSTRLLFVVQNHFTKHDIRFGATRRTRTDRKHAPTARRAQIAAPSADNR